MQHLYFDTFESPLGTIYLVLDHNDQLVELRFDHPHIKVGDCPEGLRNELDDYFEGKLTRFDWPLSLESGTDFEQAVWLALRKVPYGETRPYKWIASQVGRPKGSRAVGQALSKNPLPIVLPCHRVVETQGNLGGYSSGVDIKRRLLSLEYYHSMARSRP